MLDGVITAQDLEESFFAEESLQGDDRKGAGSEGVARAETEPWWLQGRGAAGVEGEARKCHLEEVEVEVGIDGGVAGSEGGQRSGRETAAKARVKWSLYRERNGKGRGDGVVDEVYFVRQGVGEEMRIWGVGVGDS